MYFLQMLAVSMDSTRDVATLYFKYFIQLNTNASIINNNTKYHAEKHNAGNVLKQMFQQGPTF